MPRMDDLRAQYQFMAENAPTEVKMLYQGVVMGIDLCRGAVAEDLAQTMKEELAQRPVANGEPSWRKAAARGTRNPNLKVVVYGLTDPRAQGDPIFYVGSAQDPSAQLQDYIRSEEVKVSAKPMIDEIVGDGAMPGIRVLEAEVPLPEATAVKEKYILQLQEAGTALVNQRRGS